MVRLIFGVRSHDFSLANLMFRTWSVETLNPAMAPVASLTQTLTLAEQTDCDLAADIGIGEKNEEGKPFGDPKPSIITSYT
jgi:hypothetical protein